MADIMKIAAAALFTVSLCGFAAESPKLAAQQSAEAVQPAVETLDLATISRIRDEGLNHSRIMEYGSGLFDGVGARLTGSPDFAKGAAWAVDQLTRMGAVNARTESWGDFGMGWQQVGTSVFMTTPGMATFLAQATPWSPATAGEVSGQVILLPVIEDEKALEKWKGKLAGKIVLYGPPPPHDPDPKPPLDHTDKTHLDQLSEYPLDARQPNATGPAAPSMESRFAKMMFQEKVARFLADEHVLAVLKTNGEASMFHDDTGSSFGWYVYEPQHKQAIPSAVVSPDAYGRMARLVEHGVPVSVKVNINTRFTGDHVDGENVTADIPGTDPALKDQVVLLGGHLDSWIAGTGATDNGAGTIIAIEAMRILKTLNIHPRRTIRIGLWGGEEQGIFGSLGYVNSHLATIKYPDIKDVPTFLLKPSSITVKPDFANFDVYFNADNGSGRFLGIYAEGNSAAANVFRQWEEPIKDLGFSTISLRHTGSTDHVNFDMVGLPGFQYIQDRRDYGSRTHHTNLDTYERLSEPDLKQAATIMAIFVYNASQRDAMFPRKPMPDPAQEQKDERPLEGIYPK
jgi:carboxypeptidase Q